MRVAIVGTGYVGLVTGACLAHVGHDVICIDKDPERIRALSAGLSPIHEIGLDTLLIGGLAEGRLSFSTSYESVGSSDVSMICVGTPSGADGIDLSDIRHAAAAIGAELAATSRYHVVVVKSTVVPGTTDQAVLVEVEAASGRLMGQGLGLAMNPEFLSQGTAVNDLLEPDRIIIGEWDRRSGDVVTELYLPFSAPVLRMSIRNAEMCKYAANAFQATLISFANQIAGICEHVPGTDHLPVMESVHLDRNLRAVDGSVGAIRFLRGGIGFGGSCFPKDLAALQHFATMIGAPSEMIDAALAVNRRRPGDVVARLSWELGGIRGRTITLLGLAFKPGTDDVRESPGIAIAKRLSDEGASVRTHDPLPAARERAKQALPPSIAILSSAEQALRDSDAAILATAWPQYRECDWAVLLGSMRRRLIFDGRNHLMGLSFPTGTTLIRIGTGPDGNQRSLS